LQAHKRKPDVEARGAELAQKKSDAAADTAAKIADAEKENAAEQSARRNETREAVGAQRGAWTAEQQGVITDADAKASGNVVDVGGAYSDQPGHRFQSDVGALSGALGHRSERSDDQMVRLWLMGPWNRVPSSFASTVL
jgi:hypothetical protein